jgi:hypothetical protein
MKLPRRGASISVDKRTGMKSREIYAWIIGFIFAVIIFRMMDGDWATVSVLLIGLVPFLQDLRRKIEEDK